MRTILPTLAWWLAVAASVSCASGVDSWDDPGRASPDASPPHASSGGAPSGGSSGGGASSSGAGSSGASVDAGVGGALADAYGGGAGDDASSAVPDDAGGPDWFTLPTLEAASPEPDAGGDALPAKCASQICFDGFDCLFAGCGTSCVALHCQ